MARVVSHDTQEIHGWSDILYPNLNTKQISFIPGSHYTKTSSTLIKYGQNANAETEYYLLDDLRIGGTVEKSWK